MRWPSSFIAFTAVLVGAYVVFRTWFRAEHDCVPDQRRDDSSMSEIVAPVAQQAQEPHEGFCPFCGEPHPSRAVFCAGCGKRLSVADAVGSRDAVPSSVPGAPRSAADALPPGGIARRIVAFLIDVTVIFLAAVAYAGVAGDETGNATALILYLGAPVYMIAFECSSLRATPGKLALSMRVVNNAGTRINVGQSIGRTLLSVIGYLFFFVGFWMAAFRDDGRALQDLGTGTWVVRKERVR